MVTREAGDGRRERTVALRSEIVTPLGSMICVVKDDALVLLEFADRRMVPTQLERLRKLLGCTFRRGETALHRKVRRQLAEYFAGERVDFEIPMHVPGTPFQLKAWRALQRIPAGTTRSYAEQARIVGKPGAVRAVARANGDNRIAILIPCHRLLGSDGSLTGYGGGIWRKRALLMREGAAIPG